MQTAPHSPPTDSPRAQREEHFWMPWFHPGTRVLYKGNSARVSHVLLRRCAILVCLEGQAEPVRPEALHLPLTRFSARRFPQALHWLL